MKAIYIKRLTKLAKFLQKLPRKKFQFNHIWVVNCQSKGCAVGYCPKVFPRSWKVCSLPYRTDEGISMFGVQLKNESEIGEGTIQQSLFHASKFFGLDKGETEALFYPDSQDNFGLENLSGDATPKKVAKGILSFIKSKKES